MHGRADAEAVDRAPDEHGREPELARERLDAGSEREQHRRSLGRKARGQSWTAQTVCEARKDFRLGQDRKAHDLLGQNRTFHSACVGG